MSDVPHLPPSMDVRSPEGRYASDLNRYLTQAQREQRNEFDANERPPVFRGYLPSPQSLPLATFVNVAFTAITDTHGWWVTDHYVPKRAGFYRVSWAASFHDTAAIATSTAARVVGFDGQHEAIAYGNGVALDIPTISGSTIAYCDGAATVIEVQAYILTGTAPTLFANRTWLDIDYLGRKNG